MSDAIAVAEAAQRAASDPSVSAFVGASAGSGKTKLLTDRLLRLMLSGAPPSRILCLTFTRAAAAEMAIRLRRRLGDWAIATDSRLDTDLAALDMPTDTATRQRARMLFGQVLDLPGGMRIDTVHAFCQSLLRRFPLEAQISPHFAVADEAEAASRRRAAREAVLGDDSRTAEAALRLLAGQISETDFAGLTDRMLTDAQARLAKLASRYETVGGIAAMQAAALDAPEADEDAILLSIVEFDDRNIRATLRAMSERSSDKAREKATALLAWLDLPPAQRVARLDIWRDGFFTGAGAPRAITTLLSKALDAAEPALRTSIEAEQARLLRMMDRLAARRLADLSAALARLALPIHAAEQGAKQLNARFDYADLIARAAQLLVDPGAAWVLYKLDGGIDHILLDEVQDIAPAQWAVIDAIAAEFFAGTGTRPDGMRTVFAVGDRKQSIYSFQGADLASFDAWRAGIGARVSAAGARWHEGSLATSFRSTAPVLALVDKVFESGPARAGVVMPGETLAHGASRAGQAGSVSLWPLVAADPDPDLPPWAPAETYAEQASARRRLARAVAGWIKANIGTMRLESRGRMLAAGDVLILVRQRNEFGIALTRALKEYNVEVAGLDRMVLTETRAVADLIALARAVLLPQDDVELATVLASPLGGLSDEELMRLALGRKTSLRDTLFARADECAAFAQARDLIAEAQARADFVTPYRFFAEVLGPMGGRARLLARLGPEAAEPLDELLATALDYGAREAPSLQGFLAALDATAAEVKREAEAAGNAVRLMTVHGAKGLQAPLVILPDTTGQPGKEAREMIHWLEAPQDGGEVPIFCPRADMRSAAVQQALARSAARAAEEYNRLLYVALTRAEDHLVVCGAAPKTKLPDSCWYESVRAGFARLDGVADRAAEVPLEGSILCLETAQTAAPDRTAAVTTTVASPLPHWIGPETGWRAAPPPEPKRRIDRLVPSRSAEGESAGLAASSPLAGHETGRAAGLARGRLIHALLQHLPDLALADRREAARRYLAQPAHDLDAAEQSALIEAVFGVLDHPEMTPLFGPASRAEAPVAGIVGGVEIGGLIDRLAVLPDRVLVADYKTDRRPPDDPAGIPEAYAAQLAAYVAVLGGIYPDRRIDAVLVWTSQARVMPVPAAMLARHAPKQDQPSA
ncbi:MULTISPECIES: double-strand break repair helicase AddA [unclassified Acidiphilium]|uniref:double-strand break repair helicase AddA n=1 Tax=unclassified Acidiphilium TaxID=2617493 RepID=UPI000BD0AC3B|nr:MULTISPECIES: double-strand break repair helicase AddA [unclassified Acidiphilium]OYV56682.1 MAG: double-strand break repair helicase AddA [Acidiphilium sp. 20-67-58]HQT60876.1 double-strand break repair helicase AddA [Acidiphilium sp.]